MIGDCTLVAVVDDDADMRAALVQTLDLAGLRTQAFAGGEAALAAIDARFEGIVLTDLRMPGLDGMGLFARLAAIDADLPVIVMTGHGDIPTAVDLMGRGAYDFISKPFSPDRLLPSVTRALEKRSLILENRALREAADSEVGAGFAGSSAHAHKVRAALRTLARADLPILIEGETGTGKTLCAAMLHRLSARSGKTPVTLDCAELGEEDGAIALLGHVSGAIPGVHHPRAGAIRQADRSTLVLENIERLPLSLQRIVDRVIESGSIVPFGGDAPMRTDVVLFATASPGLEGRVEEGRFLASLYHRLAGARLELAPLRQRPEDVPILFGTFLQDAVEAAAVDYPLVGPEIIARLRTAHWPGNAHEVRAFAEKVALGVPAASRDGQDDGPPDSLKAAVARYEAEHLRAALAEAGGDVEVARARLGLPRKTLYDKLARHGITPAEFRTG